MGPILRSSGKSPLTAEQEALEERIRRMEESMTRMNGLMETLVQKQSSPPLLTDAEHISVLRARRRAEEVANNLQNAGNVETTPEEGSSECDLARGALQSRRRRTVPVPTSTAHPGGQQIPTDPAGPSRPMVEGVAPVQPGSVFARLGPFQRDTTQGAPSRPGAVPEDVRFPVRERLREGSVNTDASRQTEMSQEFSPAEIERIRVILGEPSRDGILDGDFTPLTEALLATPVPDRLRLPKVSLFDGSGDPSDHLGVYSSWARAYGYPEAIWCKLFDTTLSGEARRWWYRLPANSIGSWQDLRTRFAAQFLGGRRHLRNPAYLSRVKQGENESL